jgi:imidazole glycerol phosphate synthase subunit HisF
MGKLSDAVEVVNSGEASAVAMAHILHYGESTIKDIRDHLKTHNIEVRNYETI